MQVLEGDDGLGSGQHPREGLSFCIGLIVIMAEAMVPYTSKPYSEFYCSYDWDCTDCTPKGIGTNMQHTYPTKEEEENMLWWSRGILGYASTICLQHTVFITVICFIFVCANFNFK